ncbi:MAG TPA: hypothetical protein VNW98_06310 [Burkholderiaceae bacterium]|nr:hypothetical protein [Burkholderiaceae bacterium]
MDCPYEIVHVIDARHLIDSESYQRAFEPGQVGLLARGFYIVLWPRESTALRYDARADYLGPFPTRRAAEEAHALIGAGAGTVVHPPVEASALA